jgi:phosphoenolpyruvate carboxykinase (ATP)
MIRAALDGKLATAGHRPDPNFGLFIPDAVPDVPDGVLQPRTVWGDKQAYDQTARDLAKRFEANFKKFADQVDEKIKQAGIRAAA